MNLNKEKLLEIYKPYTSVLGPYKRKDGRMHVVLNDSDKQKSDKTKTKTISYPKALVESNIGKILEPGETIDHNDRDFTNNSRKNLIIRKLKDHIQLDALRVDPFPVNCLMCDFEFIPSKDQINNKPHATGPFCSRNCSGKYGSFVQNGGTRVERSGITKDYFKLNK